MRNLAAVCVLLVLLFPLSARAQEGNARALALAKKSAAARDALSFLKYQAARIQDSTLRDAVQSILDDPAPTFMELYPDAATKEKVRTDLVEAGLLDANVTVAQ